MIGSLSLFFLLVLHLSYSQVSWRTGQVPIRPERRVPGAIEDIPWRVEQMPLQPEQIIRADDRFSELAVSQKGLVATGGFSSKAIHLLDIKTGERSQGSIGNMWVGGIAISPDASILAVGGNSCELPEASFLQIWDLHSRSLRKSIRVGDNTISSVLFHPAGKYVYCRCSKKDDPGIYGVDIETGHVAPVFDRNRHKSANVDWQSDSIALLAVSPDGTRLVLGTWMRVRVWNLQAANEELSYPLGMCRPECKCAAVSPEWKAIGDRRK